MTIAAPRASRLVGRLDLVFAPGRSGTVLAHAHVTAPLKIVRPFPLDDGRALVQVLTLGPGLCAGDVYRIDVTVERGARAVVIMQSASRLLGMREGEHASQSVTLTVRDGGQLEYYPGLTIPYADSDFVQRVHARVDAGGRLGVLETWATGRTSRGEHLRFRRLSSRTTVAVDGAPVYADALELEPPRMDVSGTGVLEGHRYVASGFWQGAAIDPAATSPAAAGTLLAIGQAGPEQAYLRALAMDGCALGTVLQAGVRRITAAWGLEPIPSGRYTS